MAASLIGTTQQAAASIFLEQGVAVVPGAVKKETIAICRAAAAAAPACSDAAITNNIRDLDASAPGAHHAAVRLHRRDFAEYLKRDDGRVDLRFNSDAAPFDALLRETRLLYWTSPRKRLVVVQICFLVASWLRVLPRMETTNVGTRTEIMRTANHRTR